MLARTGCLINHNKSEGDDHIKPQGDTSKIDIPDSLTRNEETFKCTDPSAAATPEEIELGNVATDICKEEVENDNKSLVTWEHNNEADLELRGDEEINDVSVAEH